jgi:hypothetical protein
MFSGDSMLIYMSIVDETNAPLNISGMAVEWAAARNVQSPPLIRKTTGAGIIVTDGPFGKLTIEILPADTAVMTPGTYYHETELTDGSARVSTVAIGFITVYGDLV